jgi:hypothetical protein
VTLFRSLPLRESGFGLDTEITAAILRHGYRPFEVPVSYHSRSKEQGKKINWRDGVQCLSILARVRQQPPAHAATAAAPVLDETQPGPNSPRTIRPRDRRVGAPSEFRRVGGERRIAVR